MSTRSYHKWTPEMERDLVQEVSRFPTKSLAFHSYAKKMGMNDAAVRQHYYEVRSSLMTVDAITSGLGRLQTDELLDIERKLIDEVRDRVPV